MYCRSDSAASQIGEPNLAANPEVADMETRASRIGRATEPTYTGLYDGQCEICQGSVSWLRTLDRRNRTTCLPISVEALAKLDARLKLDECLRQLHVLS